MGFLELFKMKKIEIIISIGLIIVLMVCAVDIINKNQDKSRLDSRNKKDVTIIKKEVVDTSHTSNSTLYLNGYNLGMPTRGGQYNTCIGHKAGKFLEPQCKPIGYDESLSQAIGQPNAMIGYKAGKCLEPQCKPIKIK